MCRKRFDTERICAETCSQTKGENDNTVENGQEQSCLKVTDLVRRLLPALPNVFPHIHGLHLLEQRVDERHDCGALS